MAETTRRGRPRSAESRGRILSAVAEILVSDGYEAVTTRAVAARAKVSRQTIFRWWPSTPALVAEAVREGAIVLEYPRVPTTGNLEADFVQWVEGFLASAQSAKTIAVSRALAAAAALDEEEADSLFRLISEPGQASLVRRLSEATRAGALDKDADCNAAADVISGVLLLHLLTRRPIDSDSAKRVVRIVLRGIGAATDIEP